MVFDSHGGGEKYMCFVIDTIVSESPHAYRLDDGHDGNVTIDSKSVATITYCSHYHRGYIVNLVKM